MTMFEVSYLPLIHHRTETFTGRKKKVSIFDNEKFSAHVTITRPQISRDTAEHVAGDNLRIHKKLRHKSHENNCYQFIFLCEMHKRLAAAANA